MVLRSSPWESRTSLTNKGHFHVSTQGPLTGPFFDANPSIPPPGATIVAPLCPLAILGRNDGPLFSLSRELAKRLLCV